MELQTIIFTLSGDLSSIDSIVRTHMRSSDKDIITLKDINTNYTAALLVYIVSNSHYASIPGVDDKLQFLQQYAEASRRYIPADIVMICEDEDWCMLQCRIEVATDCIQEATQTIINRITNNYPNLEIETQVVNE